MTLNILCMLNIFSIFEGKGSLISRGRGSANKLNPHEGTISSDAGAATHSEVPVLNLHET